MMFVLLQFTLCLALLFSFGCTESPKVTVLTKGAQLHGANGIMFGPDGRLYIASVLTPGIAIMNPETGEIEQLLGPEQGVKGPDDVAFGPDGSLYWTDIAFGEVGRRTPGGEKAVVANLGPGPNPITFSDDGRLFVAQCFFGDKLFEVDPKGVKEPRLISDQLGPGCGLNGMDWGPDGFLYGPRWFQREVVRVDVESGRFETVASGFGVPAAVKFDSKQRLHVLDTLAGEIVRVDRESGTRTVVGRIPPSGGDNLAFDEQDRMFVSSYADGFVVEVLDANNNRTVCPGGLIAPGGLALVRTGDGERLYVADLFALRELDPTTGEERHTVRDVIGFSDLGSAFTAHWDGDHLLITSWMDNDVKLWDPRNDRLVARFEGFERPIDAISFEGDIVVSEYDTGRVLRFGTAAPEEREVLASGLGAPAGLAFVGRDLYVSDQATGRIFQILENGEPLEEPRPVASGLAGPEGLAEGEDGRILVVEAGAGRVVTIDPDSGESHVLADNLELHIESQGFFPSTALFNGIAVGNGRVFVSADRANLIYSIDTDP